jgi:hypothetical protein
MPICAWIGIVGGEHRRKDGDKDQPPRMIMPMIAERR